MSEENVSPEAQTGSIAERFVSNIEATISQPEEIVPLNLLAVLDWCQELRPDLRPVVWAERNNNAFILLLTTGFEAGRHFQHGHPDFPFGAEASTLYVNQAMAMTASGQKVKPV